MRVNYLNSCECRYKLHIQRWPADRAKCVLVWSALGDCVESVALDETARCFSMCVQWCASSCVLPWAMDSSPRSRQESGNRWCRPDIRTPDPDKWLPSLHPQARTITAHAYQWQEHTSYKKFFMSRSQVYLMAKMFVYVDLGKKTHILASLFLFFWCYFGKNGMLFFSDSMSCICNGVLTALHGPKNTIVIVTV